MTTFRKDPTAKPTTAQMSAKRAITASKVPAPWGWSRDDPQDLLNRRHAGVDLGQAGPAQGQHALRDSQLLDVLRVATIDDQSFDLLGDEEHLVHGEAPEIAGFPAGLTTFGAE